MVFCLADPSPSPIVGNQRDKTNAFSATPAGIMDTHGMAARNQAVTQQEDGHIMIVYRSVWTDR